MYKQVILAVVMGIITWQASADIVDGSFESLSSVITGPSGYETRYAGGTGASLGSSWTLTSGSVDVIKSYWSAQEGSISLDMNGLSPGSISQTFNTVINQKYSLSFYMSGNPDAGGGVRLLDVSAGGTVRQYSYDTLSHGNSATDMGWVQQTFTFTANSTSTTLTFSSPSAGNYGAALDNISGITAVPEASTWLAGLGATGMLLVGLRMHARRSGVVRLN